MIWEGILLHFAKIAIIVNGINIMIKWLQKVLLMKLHKVVYHMFYSIAILKLEINNYLIFYFSFKYDFILLHYSI